MKTFILLLITFCTTIGSSYAQVEYEKRVEIDLQDGFVGESVITFGDKGLIVRSRQQKKEDGNEKWRFQKFNTSLEEIETVELLTEKEYFFDESTETDERHFILYQTKRDDFLLFNLEIDNMVLSKVEGTFPKKSQIKDMKILGDYAYFTAYIRREPVLFTVNWKTGKTQIIPIVISGYSRSRISVQNIQVLTESNEVFVYVIVYNSRKKSDLYVIRLDDEGEKQGVFNLTNEIDRNIVDISSFKLNDEQYVFTGTYSTKSATASEGLFFSQTTGENIDFIEFYNFLDLEDFLSYLPERKENRVERRRDKKESRGGELKINYRIADHELIELDDGHLFIGEAYYPTYRQESYTSYSMVNGVSTPVTSSRSVFSGYQYTHAVIAKFSKTGEIMWDRIFRLQQTGKPYYVKRFINISEATNEGIKLAYSSNFKIVSKYIDYNGEILEDVESEEIETGFDGDKTRWSSSNLSYWYDNYFIAYGQQKIRNNKDDSVENKRKVLFFNKVSY